MLGQGEDPCLWMARSLRENRIETTDRSIHDLWASCDAMWCAGTYDQLNLGFLAAIEMIS